MTNNPFLRGLFFAPHGREMARRYKEAFQRDPVLNALLADLTDALKAKDRERIRDLGQKFDKIGGFEMMQQAASCFYPHRNFNDLSMYWNHIGEWLY